MPSLRNNSSMYFLYLSYNIISCSIEIDSKIAFLLKTYHDLWICLDIFVLITAEKMLKYKSNSENISRETIFNKYGKLKLFLLRHFTYNLVTINNICHVGFIQLRIFKCYQFKIYKVLSHMYNF